MASKNSNSELIYRRPMATNLQGKLLLSVQAEIYKYLSHLPLNIYFFVFFKYHWACNPLNVPTLHHILRDPVPFLTNFNVINFYDCWTLAIKMSKRDKQSCQNCTCRKLKWIYQVSKNTKVHHGRWQY